MRLTGKGTPRRLSGVLAVAAALVAGPAMSAPQASSLDFKVSPIDPQRWQNQYDMTWADWKNIPGTRWNDPNAKPSGRGLRIALVTVDFPDQPFVITKPKKSDQFGNPQIDPIPRADVPRFYHDYYLIPNVHNHGRTIHEYWMEQSRGKLGVGQMDVFGAYRLPRNLFEYGLNEWGQTAACPKSFTCNGNLDNDADTVWKADLAARGIPCPDSKCGYDVILRVYAGYDETSIWQEFGEMRFTSKEDIPDEWGPHASIDPDNTMPNWAPTRYVEWTSWRAAAQQWGLASIRQAESSGTITHEMGHYFFNIGDNNNNPFSDRQNPPSPLHRVGSAPWDMMDRGSFNGPGGHHMRWVIPPNMGGWSPAGLMLRNKIHAGIVPTDNVQDISREALDGAGRPDRTPDCDINTDPFCHGNLGWDHYTLEVVDRMGFDSFTPDSGVIIAKNKTGESNTCGYNCFNWVIDANPGDIGLVDFHRPDGTPVMASIADHRQLNDAAFHAGLNSGSAYEWVDQANRLHFYVIGIRRDGDGVLSYTLAVRSLDGSGPQRRSVRLSTPTVSGVQPGLAAKCSFPLTNTGQAATNTAGHTTTNVTAKLKNDVYRLSVSSRGRGWTAQLDNALTTTSAGATVTVPVYVSRTPGSAQNSTVTLTAKSESDPTVTRSRTCTVDVDDTTRR